MSQQCIDQQIAPDMEPGDTLEHGQFFRNLKKKHVAKRYAGDDDGHPEYGFKFTKPHWIYADRQPGQLSVNLRSCMRSEVCSIALHPGGENYFHVAVIDLATLNQSLDSSFVAQYSPLCDNACHFEIMPLDGTVSKWMELGELFDRPFPPGKMPNSKQDKAKAAKEYAEYRAYCDIQRWVRRKDGSLQLPDDSPDPEPKTDDSSA